jgi:hypothetical protein
VLNVFVPEPCLQRPRVVTGVGQGIAAGVAQRFLQKVDCRNNALIKPEKDDSSITEPIELESA